jgi:hypothetical protein
MSPSGICLFPSSLAARVRVWISSGTLTSVTFSFWRIRYDPRVKFLFTGPTTLLAPEMPGSVTDYAFLFASHHNPLEAIYRLQELDRRRLKDVYLILTHLKLVGA